jgi:hypothetical protein
MTTKRDLTANKGESAERTSARRNQLGERHGEDGPHPVTSRKTARHEREDDPDAGIHDA